MITYKVTTELRTPFWWKVLRFFRLKSKREEFEIEFKKDWYGKRHIIRNNNCNVLILGYGKLGVD